MQLKASMFRPRARQRDEPFELNFVIHGEIRAFLKGGGGSPE